MIRFVEGEDRRRATLLPSCLDDYVIEENPVPVCQPSAAKAVVTVGRTTISLTSASRGCLIAKQTARAIASAGQAGRRVGILPAEPAVDSRPRRLALANAFRSASLKLPRYNEQGICGPETRVCRLMPDRLQQLNRGFCKTPRQTTLSLC